EGRAGDRAVAIGLLLDVVLEEPGASQHRVAAKVVGNLADGRVGPRFADGLLDGGGARREIAPRLAPRPGDVGRASRGAVRQALPRQRERLVEARVARERPLEDDA